MNEKDVDTKFLYLIDGFGIVTIKLTTLGMYGSSGWPDRLCILPGGHTVWVELKRPGGKASALQTKRQQTLKDLGHAVGTFDDAYAAARFVGFELRKCRRRRVRRLEQREGSGMGTP